jgi:hypothetical protein
VDEPELFDWGFEVQPIVATIVYKTLEQAFFEVHEEEELANVRRHKEAIEHRRNVELSDVQRLEEAERRKFEEKQKRMEERLKREAEARDLRAKLASRGFGEFFAIDLIGETISLLERRGYFYDEVEREIEGKFLPWLGRAMDEAAETHALTDAIVAKVGAATAAFEHDMRSKNDKAIDAIELEERQGRRGILRQMFIEDRGAAKIRKALEGTKKTKRQAGREEEDETDSSAN